METPTTHSSAEIFAKFKDELRELILVCLDFSESREILGRKLNTYQLNNQKVADLLIHYEIARLSIENHLIDAHVPAQFSRLKNAISSAYSVLEISLEIMCGQIYVDGTEASQLYHRCRTTVLEIRELTHEN